MPTVHSVKKVTGYLLLYDDEQKDSLSACMLVGHIILVTATIVFTFQPPGVCRRWDLVFCWGIRGSINFELTFQKLEIYLERKHTDKITIIFNIL